jgi:putative glycosyltransferase
MKLSIVTTLYKSAAHVEEFYRRASAAAAAVTEDYEIVMVDDGSPDDSLDIAIGLHEHDARVRILSLSRNFGHNKAMMAGLGYARGDLTFLIDVDLEVGPECLVEFYADLTRSHADVVYGVQDAREDALVNRLGGWMFYAVFNRLSPHRLPVNLTTARLMTRRYVDALCRHQEREMIIAGLWVITGYKQVPRTVRKLSRRESSYNLGRRIALLIDAVIAFSNRPLIFIFYLGLFISLLSSFGAALLIARRVFFGTVASGWLSLIVSTWLLGGLIIFCLGVIGFYLSKVFIETKQRPYTIVRDVYDRCGGAGTRGV